MTRDEAIKIINTVLLFGKCDCAKEEIEEFLRMAIKALEQEPCEDCVSRQAVEEMIKAELPERGMWEIEGDKEIEAVCEVCVELMQKLSEVPSVAPQPKTGQSKTGHWIRFKSFPDSYFHIKCSECGQYWSMDGHAKVFKYCFNCGAKMEVEENG